MPVEVRCPHLKTSFLTYRKLNIKRNIADNIASSINTISDFNSDWPLSGTPGGVDSTSDYLSTCGILEKQPWRDKGKCLLPSTKRTKHEKDKPVTLRVSSSPFFPSSFSLT